MSNEELQKPRNGTIVNWRGWNGFPVSYRVTGLPASKLVEQIKTALAELEGRATVGDTEAVPEFEQILKMVGENYLHKVRTRAKSVTSHSIIVHQFRNFSGWQMTQLLVLAI